MVHTVRHLNLAPDNTKLNVGQIFFHSSLQKSLTIAIRKGMSNHCNYWTNDSPHFFWYTDNLKSVTLVAPVLTWGSPALSRAPTRLICKNLEREESRRGRFDCGQLWKWLCAMKPGQTMPDLNPHPLHSLRFPTRDISGPSIAKVLLQYSRCKRGKQQGRGAEKESATTTSTNTRAPFKRTALSNSMKTCGMQLWSRGEYICWER